MSLEAVKYERGKFFVLDQTRIPLEFEYEEVKTVQETFDSIRGMKVRGAPAIALVACLGMCAAIHHKFIAPKKFPKSGMEAKKWIIEKLKYLGESRPTAQNLFRSINELTELMEKDENSKKDGEEAAEKLFNNFTEFAEKITQQGIDECHNMSEFGAEYMKKMFGGKKLRVLTHCNAGALATAKIGTAVGVMVYLWKKGCLERAYNTETRPYNQGARLTAFEFHYEKIPNTLVCDSAVSWLFKKHKLDAVVVGADRICANGDTANKIGTYHIAVSCKEHNIPFFVAAPSTTVDLKTDNGDDVPIEERPTTEVTHCPHHDPPKRVVVETVNVWNPAFDVTPAKFIKAIFTEKGVVLPNEKGEFDMKKYLLKK